MKEPPSLPRRESRDLRLSPLAVPSSDSRWARLHPIVHKCRIRPVAQIGPTQYDPPSLPRTTSWDGQTNSSSPSQTFLIAPSTKKLGIQLKDYTSSGYPWVFMSLSRTHCRNAGISAEMLCSPVLKYFLRNSSPSKPASDQPNNNPSDEPHLRLLLILVDILVKREFRLTSRRRRNVRSLP